MQQSFVQIGASRDGREGYLAAARRRGMRAVLVETPDYLALRRRLGRAAFDEEIGISRPASADAVAAALRRIDFELPTADGPRPTADDDLPTAHGLRPTADDGPPTADGPPPTAGTLRLVLPGFERYAECAHAVGAELGVPCGSSGFRPPGKYEQRQALRRHAPDIVQPAFHAVPAEPTPEWAETLSYPAVLKPVDGGGGLGVVRVSSPVELLDAIRRVNALRNYDNTPFRSLLVEAYVDGEEWSVQGIACGGRPYVLGYCAKVIAVQPDADGRFSGFREVAHVAVGPDHVPSRILDFVDRTTQAMGYRDGPFHIDLREGIDGPVFIEMGFRLSGAAVTDLVRDVSGCDWADAAFSWLSGEGQTPCGGGGVAAAAQVLAFSDGQLQAARRGCGGLDITIEQIPPARALVSDDEAGHLAADLSRHAGPLARIHIRGTTQAAVRDAAIRLSRASAVD